MGRTLKLLRSLLKGYVPDDELHRLSGGFDTLGSIAIVKLPTEWSAESKRRAGELLMLKVPRIKSVWNQTSPVRGEYRVRGLEHIAGDTSTVTEYREAGVRMFVDVASAYFSPRLSTERLRVADNVKNGERIFNMFSGVGSFSLVIAKKAGQVTILSSEINPVAFKLMVRNVELNRMQNRVFPVLGDCRDQVEGNEGTFDRVIMSLPSGSWEFLPYAIRACKPGAMVHYYSSVRSEERRFVEDEWKRVSSTYPFLVLRGSRVVTELGPRTKEIVLDMVCERTANPDTGSS